MISESVGYVRRLGREVIYDAEHFFDGYRLDAEYALAHVCGAARRCRGGLHRPVRYEWRGAPGGRGTAGARRPAISSARRSVSILITTAASPWPTALAAVACGVRACPGHDQRVRRALRQSRPDPAHRDAAAQAGLSGAAARAAASPPGGGAVRSGGREPESRCARARTSGRARLPTRGASTSRPWRSCRRVISTSIRRSWGTRRAWW